MNRILAVCLSMVCAFSAVAAPAADGFKVAFVNAELLLNEAPQAEAARKRLVTEFAPREKELATAQRELRTLEEKMAKDGAVMSEPEQRKLERDILAAKREIKNSQDEFRDDLNIRRNDELGKLQREVYEVIVALAKQENYDIIVGEGVIYASDQVDISKKVLERLKGDFKGGGTESKAK